MRPQLQTLERIAKALNVEVSELFSPKSDFTALIDNKGEMKHFDTVEQAKEYLEGIR